MKLKMLVEQVLNQFKFSKVDNDVWSYKIFLFWDWRNGTVGRTLALHVVDLVLMLGTP